MGVNTNLPLKSLPKLHTLPPPLKWAGGKRWQLPYLRELWANHYQCRLVEPFCGGLAVALGLMPKVALLNDVNPHLINFYKWLQKGLRIDLPMENCSETYYAHRAEFNHLLASGKQHTAKAAQLFYYLNRTGYNGLCRFNRSGEFNVPFGKYRSITYKSGFSEYLPLFAQWKFMHGDFEKIPLRPRDFVYADPPYDVEFRSYSQEGFSWEDQERTAEFLAKHKGPVILSNQATPRIVSLYRKLGFAVQILQAPRRISCTGDRSPAAEVLATRNISA